MMMSIKPALAIALMMLTTACTSTLALDRRQAATLSPQAVATLKSLRVFRLPLIKPSSALLLKMRARFAELQRRQTEELVARLKPTIEDTTIENVKVRIITPLNLRAEDKDKIILFIHGGGYIMGSPTDRTALLMANELGMKTYSIDYQLAPEAKFPVALDECLLVYNHLVLQLGANRIVGISASSGSGHMLAMLLKAQEQGLPMIKAIALLSPSVDLTPRGDSVTANEGRDILAYDNQADKLYVPPFVGDANLEDPLVSPINGTYVAGFPATVIVTGTRDGVLSGSVRLYWKLRAAHVPVELLVSEGMWHGFFSAPDMPEAIVARHSARDFLRSQL
jgi:acetyl esterase/lipase